MRPIPRPGPDPSPLTRRTLLAGGVLGLAACRAPARTPAPSAAAPRADAAALEQRARDDEALAALVDQRGSVAPIPAAARAQRRARCGRLCAELGFDALWCESGTTLEWLSDVRWGRSERLFALVVCADGSHFWIVPAFEAEKARLSIEKPGGPGGEIVTWEEDEHPYRALADALARRGARRIAVEPALRFGFVERLGALVGRDALASAQELLVRLRGVKEPAERAILRRASELTQLALATVGTLVRPGMQGGAIARLMERAHARLGLNGSWCLPLVGPAAALPHGDASDEAIAPGSVILVDTGATLHGYDSDTTRSWVFGGRATAEVERAWHAVRDAQQRAFETIRPGARCQDVDRAARALFAERGYAAGYRDFTHRLGHGIGVEGHEDPYFDGGSEVVLQPGMTFTDEPGLYFPGKFGLRIEDVVEVTSSGADHYGRWQRSLAAPE